jgi:hypothetical protein
VPLVRIVPKIIGSAEFFIPLIATSPFSGIPPQMINFSIVASD